MLIEHLDYLIFAIVLLVILIISFGSRAKVFCQYMNYMTGLHLTPKEVQKVYRTSGKAGVRELFLDLLIREDLAEAPVITPETPPSKPVAGVIDR